MSHLNRYRSILLFVALGALWLASFRMADALTFFKTYSSIWFLPTGVTMAIVMVAPGWLKLAPLVANLLVALPQVRAFMGVSVVHDYEPILHGMRLFAVYGGAGYVLTRFVKIDLPSTSLRDYQWITTITLAAVTIATLSGVGMHMLTGNVTMEEAREIVWSWWLGDAIGAFAVPPLLVPLLLRLLWLKSAEWRWPTPRSWLEQIWLILLIFLSSAALFILSGGALQFWHLLIVPPLLFALRGGLPLAATCVFLTVATVPVLVAALALQQQLTALTPLLLTTTVAGLLLGAAMSDRQKVLSGVEQLVEARTQQLKEAHEFQRHLIRSIGHDMRQPIDGMNMVLEGLERFTHHPGSSAAIRQARQIGALASQLLATILTYARFDAGTIKLQATQFPVERLFGSLAQLFEPFADLKDVRLVWHHQNDILYTDENLLGQALSNLLDNAIRLSDPGMVVTISLEPTTDTVAIIVTDTISPQTQTPGTAGFGLDIVAKIAAVLNAKTITEPHRRGLVLRREKA